MAPDKKEYQNPCYPIYEEDEIDLYELWLTIKKYKLLILSIIILAMIASMIYIFSAQKIYTVENILFLPNLKTINDKPIFNKNDIKSLLTNLDKYDERTLKRYLKLDEKEIEAFKGIKVTDIKRGNLLKIKIDVTDVALSESIFNKILDYINSLDLIKESILQNKYLLEKERDNLRSKISEYNYLIKKLRTFNPEKDNIYLGFDPYSALLETEQKYNLVIETLKKYDKFNKVTYLSDPIFPDYPTKPKSKLIIVVSFITSLIFGMFLAFFVEWYKQAKVRYEKNN